MIAFLYPGQGSQRPGMLHELPDTPHARATTAEACSHLGRPLDALDSAGTLATTTGAQIVLVVAGVSAARALTADEGIEPGVVAGHSVGAFAAAVTAGVLTLPEAIDAVRRRGELMTEACRGGNWGMAAVLGLPQAAVEQLVVENSTGENPLWVANINASDQIVLSGTRAALGRLRAAASGYGAQEVRMLDVAVASHCPLHVHVAEAMADHLAAIPRRPQLFPYLSNAGGRRIRNDPDALLGDLAASVARPVQWLQASRLIGELGVTAAAQMPPGDVLAKLVARASPGVTTLAVGTGGIHDVAARLRRIR